MNRTVFNVKRVALLIMINVVSFSVSADELLLDKKHMETLIVPIIEECKDYAIEFITPLSDHGILKYKFKESIFTLPFLPEFVGYLEIERPEKNPLFAESTATSIYMNCRPVIPNSMNYAPGRLRALGESLERLEEKGFKESYIEVTEETINYYLVDDRLSPVNSVPKN